MNKRTYDDFLQTISRKPTRQECAYLARYMRKADVAEAHAAGAITSGDSLALYLLTACQTSDIAVTVYNPDSTTPVAIYGVVSFPDIPGVGFVWMHGTDVLGAQCKQDFLRLGRFAVEELRTRYRLLVCFADSRNTLHTRWLRWCGFTPINKYPVFDPQVPFLEFVLPGKQEVVCAHP